MGDDYDPLKGSKFNMAQLILFRIHNMETRAANFYREGDFRSWYFEWKNIKLQVIGKFSGTERKTLKKLERLIETQKKKSIRIRLIERYVIKMQDLLEEKEIGLISKGDDTVFA